MKQAVNVLVLFLMLLFVIQGCSKYQKDQLAPVDKKVSSETSPITDTTLDLDEEVTPDSVSSDEAEVDTPPVETENKKSLEDLLDTFFGIFVLPINRVNEPFDTRVDYERLNDLRVKKNKTFVDLVTKIERKFRDKDALKGKSEAYKKAFYVNAYNYFAIRLINRFYIKDGKRVKSILDLSEGLNPHQIFDARFIRVHSEELVSLNTVEKDYLSELTKDKDGRYHFAVICVSKGCPITLNRAYRAETLEEQLTEITKASLRLPRMLNNDNDNKKTYLTKIFDWYEDHFIDDKGSVKEFIEHYGGQVLYSIKYSDYDWSLNGLTSETVVDSKPTLPTDGDNGEDQQDGEGSGSGAPKDHPCKALKLSEEERVISLCSNLLSGKEHKLTMNTVTEANLCILRNATEDKYIIRGTLDSKDKDGIESLVDVDFSAAGKVDNEGFIVWKHKDSVRHEAKFNPEEMTLKFRQNTKKVRRSIRKITVGCE